MNNFLPLLSSCFTLMRYLIAIWCIMLVFFSSIIMKHRAQRKKLHEVASSLRIGVKIITCNELAGKVILVTHQTVIIELASGQKKEVPHYLIDHVYSD